VIGAVTIPSKVLIGRVSDRVGRRGVGIICALLHTVALLWLAVKAIEWHFYVEVDNSYKK